MIEAIMKQVKKMAPNIKPAYEQAFRMPMRFGASQVLVRGLGN